MVSGRSSEPRPVTVTTTNASTALTGSAGTFNEEDAGRAISATGIPTGATLASVTSDTAAVLSANATATGSRSAVLGGNNLTDSLAYGFLGWSPESDAESETYTVTSSTAPPDKITNATTRVVQRSRDF